MDASALQKRVLKELRFCGLSVRPDSDALRELVTVLGTQRSARRVGRVPFQKQSDDTSEDDSTSGAPDDTSDDDSTSAAPPLLSAGATTAGTTLPSVSVPPNLGSKAREQRVSDVTAKVDAGRMLKPGGKRVSWSKTELLKLMQAVDRHGRDWVSVSRDVGSKTRLQCQHKVETEVDAGRMLKPGGKRVSWSKTELLKLMQAVDRHGRDWVSVSRDVGSKTNKQCKGKVKKEVAAGRMQEPGGKRVYKREQESWSQAELVQLKAAVDRHGRDWAAVSRDVGSRTTKQCFRKVEAEVAAGRIEEPGGKQERVSWSQAELVQLKAAVDRHGRDWAAVSRDVGSRTGQQCCGKVDSEVAAGRMQKPVRKP